MFMKKNILIIIALALLVTVVMSVSLLLASDSSSQYDDKNRQVKQASLSTRTANAESKKDTLENFSVIEENGKKHVTGSTQFSPGYINTYKVTLPDVWQVTKDLDGDRMFMSEDGGINISLKTRGGHGPINYDIKNETKILNERKYLKRSWHKDGKVHLIAYIVEDYPAPFEGVLISLPEMKNSEAQDLINQIMETLQYSSEKIDLIEIFQ